MSETAVAPSQQLRVILTSNGLEEERAVLIAEKFNDFFLQGNEWAERAKGISVTSSEQVIEMKQAREGRLFLKQRRVGIENLRKDLKERSLKEGRAIDMIAKHLTSLIEPTEKYLEEQERFPIREMARLRREMLDSRLERLKAFDSERINENTLSLMSEQEFVDYLDTCRQLFEGAQQDKRERETQQQREAQEREQLRKQVAEQVELLKIAEKDKQELRDTAKVNELDAQKYWEHKRNEQREEEEQQRQDSLATDRDKALRFATAIAKLHIPEVENDDAQTMIAHAHSLLIQAQAYLERHANKL